MRTDFSTHPIRNPQSEICNPEVMKRWLTWLWHLIFPPRASTQTWMFLTFALFVGLAVVGVGGYVFTILGVQIQEAERKTLVDQATDIALRIEAAPSDSIRGQIVADVSKLLDLHITVVQGDQVRWQRRPVEFVSAGPLVQSAEVQALEAGEEYYARARNPNGERVVFVALSRLDPGYTIGIEQPEPPLLAMVRSVQVTLVLGMIMALLMALVGSWIAADKVTKPLQAIRRSAQQVTQGELDEPIQVDTRSAEIQDLAKNLDRMSESFREKIDELERLTRLQSEFIGNVSHEVRNPIFATSGYLEALGSPRLDDERRKRYAEKGLQNLQRLASLFNDLIEIARLEYREDIIKARVFDLAALIEEAAEMLRPKAEEKGLQLNVANSPTMVRADRNRIRQVFVNLIDNAIAYSEEGTIRCRFRRRLDKIRVEVVDTGRGIGEEHLERIFERFYRVDTGRSRKAGGTGLGLSIVKQILQAHGEPIHVESTLGRGTRFWFELPFVEETEAVEATA